MKSLELEPTKDNIIETLKGKYSASSKIGKIKTWIIAITIVISYINYFQKIKYPLVIICSIITFITQILVIIDPYIPIFAALVFYELNKKKLFL